MIRVEHLVEDFYKDDVDVSERHLLSFEKSLDLKSSSLGGDGLMDEVDRKLLGFLSVNANKSLVFIAERLGLSIDVVRYRLSKLKEFGIIRKFVPFLDLTKFGYTKYLYIFSLKNYSPEMLLKFKKEIMNNTSVVYSFFDVFSFSLVCVCCFKYAVEVDELSRSLKKKFGVMIASEEYFIVREELCFNLFPSGLISDY